MRRVFIEGMVRIGGGIAMLALGTVAWASGSPQRVDVTDAGSEDAGIEAGIEDAASEAWADDASVEDDASSEDDGGITSIEPQEPFSTPNASMPANANAVTAPKRRT